MFGWVDFKEDEKKKKKKEGEKMGKKTFFVSIWLKGGEKKTGGASVFSPQIGKKTKENINGL